MNEILGFLLAFGAAVAWGSYAVPFKISKSSNLIHFQAVMGLGIFLSGFIISLLSGYSLTLNIYGLISGFLWAVANVLGLMAVLNLGLSRATPLIASLVILSSYLWGSIVFQELPQGFISGLLGILFIIFGVALVSTVGVGQSLNVRKGILVAFFAGLIFGSQLAPLKIGKVATEDFFFSTTVGIFITALVIFFATKGKFKNEAIGLSLLSGMVWNIGNLLSVIAISVIGIAKAMPFTQASSLVAVLWGIFYFKEISRLRQKIQVLLGAIILLVGIAILGSA